MGRLVKDWAKRHELVGTTDGYLNSYAYMLLAIHYLQSIEPQVIPNLQHIARDDKQSKIIKDHKWGGEDQWETAFGEDTTSLDTSSNKQTVGEMLIGFFHYFLNFNWREHAVCIRMNKPGLCVDKFSLTTATSEDQWYAEDPFELKHNLAGRCTQPGQDGIREQMQK